MLGSRLFFLIFFFAHLKYFRTKLRHRVDYPLLGSVTVMAATDTELQASAGRMEEEEEEDVEAGSWGDMFVNM